MFPNNILPVDRFCLPCLTPSACPCRCWFGYTYRPYYWILEGPRVAIIGVRLKYLHHDCYMFHLLLLLLLLFLKKKNSKHYLYSNVIHNVSDPTDTFLSKCYDSQEFLSGVCDVYFVCAFSRTSDDNLRNLELVDSRYACV